MKNDATPRGRRALEEQTENEYTTMESEEHLQEAIQHLCRVDKRLAAVIQKNRCELPTRLLLHPSDTCFQALCKSIIFQQLSMKAASTIYTRFLEACGVLPLQARSTQVPATPKGKRKAEDDLSDEPPPAPARGRKQLAIEGRMARGMEGADDLTKPEAAAEAEAAAGAATTKAAAAIRPSSTVQGPERRLLQPADVLGCSTEVLRACGLSGQKASYVTGIAAAFAADEAEAREGRQATLQESVLRALPEEELTAALVKLRGVGPWTADMVCMFTLGKPNILPTGDLGVRKGMQTLYGLGSPPPPAKMLEIAAPWQPWRSVGAWYMWKLAPGGGV